MLAKALPDLFPSTALFDFFISPDKRGSENREWNGLRSVEFEESPDSTGYRSG
jgi:hypothetical protein